MKKTLLATLLAMTLIHFNKAFGSDTLIYRSPFEARLLEGTINKTNTDFLALFLSINSDSATYEQYASTLKWFFGHLDGKLSSVKSGKQKARIIFKEVHTYFFKKYDEQVLFDKVFDDGSYNCLTASMFYSLVLDKYNIPYAVKEKPTHIYLVAFPGTDNILYETTNPKGLYVPDDKTKREYVAGLVAMKLITQDYVNSVGIAGAFNDYYYNNQNISLDQLAGLQYFNQSLMLYEGKNVNAAITSAVKANMLYPSPRNQYLKTSLIREAISNSNFESLTDIIYLAEYANSSPDVQSKKYVRGVFGDLLETKLIKNSDTAFVKEAHNIISGRVNDEALKSEITYNYELAMAHWFSLKGDMDEALVHAEKAYSINPNDARIQELVARAIALKTERLKGKTQAIEALQLSAEKFPFLKSNNTFRSLIVYQYSYRAYSLFLQNSGTEASRYLTLMEEEINNMGGSPITMEQLIGLAYAEAGAFYFRQKNYKKAKEILQKGLQFAPEHGELKERLRIVEDEQKQR